LISVIIPAHNEERAITRCLAALATNAAPGELDIIVVPNGCSDRTGECARLFGSMVRVVETEKASKTHALNLGDSYAKAPCRFYVDADVVLSLNDLRKLAEALQDDKILAVAPRFRMELEGCSWSVRAFYEILEQLPSSTEGIGGSGVYGLSENGRRRFDKFPDVVADDGFVRLQFAPHERATLPQCRSIVYAPKRLRDLISIKTRSHFGTVQLQSIMPQMWRNRGPTNGATLQTLAAAPRMWPKLAVYLTVKTIVRCRAMLRSNELTNKWERDESTRSPITQSQATQ
jgi:glycosyltransferase involved in cell wall biosynthesis